MSRNPREAAGYAVVEVATSEQIRPPEDPVLAIDHVAARTEDVHEEETQREQYRALNVELLREVDELRNAVIRAGALHERLDRNQQPVAGVVGSKVEVGSRAQDLVSPRELEVLAMIAEGAPNSEIAGRLVIADTTVQSHVQHILHKLGARNRTEAAGLYLRH
jgi:DNA-binding NarL/FixJ family response regulator